MGPYGHCCLTVVETSHFLFNCIGKVSRFSLKYIYPSCLVFFLLQLHIFSLYQVPLHHYLFCSYKLFTIRKTVVMHQFLNGTHLRIAQFNSNVLFNNYIIIQKDICLEVKSMLPIQLLEMGRQNQTLNLKAESKLDRHWHVIDNLYRNVIPECAPCYFEHVSSPIFLMKKNVMFCSCCSSMLV